jgi:hypothetical protein
MITACMVLNLGQFFVSRITIVPGSWVIAMICVGLSASVLSFDLVRLVNDTLLMLLVYRYSAFNIFCVSD